MNPSSGGDTALTELNGEKDKRGITEEVDKSTDHFLGGGGSGRGKEPPMSSRQKVDSIDI